jgi:hypothetical protein
VLIPYPLENDSVIRPVGTPRQSHRAVNDDCRGTVIQRIPGIRCLPRSENSRVKDFPFIDRIFTRIPSSPVFAPVLPFGAGLRESLPSRSDQPVITALPIVFDPQCDVRVLDHSESRCRVRPACLTLLDRCVIGDQGSCNLGRAVT